ncbi:hypothetical protein BV22DRAFT_1123877 [Leucogyrophana mollusca]|uniref:Uncharacterized protein n=1 Tax=Leucogyrophana mollusca TaxID=85980 RepID=A0ACB8AXL7_9AGAM|nr:hypothetical protein BV22DRAFT_1123877 [Leucogyrophana mollusca]
MFFRSNVAWGISRKGVVFPPYPNLETDVPHYIQLPAVVQQQPATQRPQTRQLSFDDWDTESICPRLTEPQRDPTPKQGTSTVQPVVSGRNWSRNIRERWRDIRHRKSRVPVDLPDGPPHLPLPLHERANIAPAPPELPANQQARPERDADTPENTQASHTRTRPSRNKGKANVAFGKLDERLFAAPPRGRKGRRFRARAQRGGVRSNPHSDSESQDSDSESEYVDTGCLDAICFGEYFRRRRYLRGR